MEKITLEKRDVSGKRNKSLLVEGYIPAVVYNAKGDSTNIKVTESLAKKILREATSTTILDADLEEKKLKVVVKEIDTNPITEVIRHIAFFEIDAEKEMVFTIPFELVGVSPAVKNNLGVMVEVLSSVDVKCKLASLVPVLEVDISTLEHPGQSIAIGDVKLPEGMSLINEDLAHATIVTVTEIQAEEVFETPVAEEAEAVVESTEEVKE